MQKALKWMMMLSIVGVMCVAVTAYSTAQAIEVPLECHGQIVICEMSSTVSCTALYCGPGVYVYDDTGKYIKTLNGGDCNHCEPKPVCKCGDFEFTPQRDPLR